MSAKSSDATFQRAVRKTSDSRTGRCGDLRLPPLEQRHRWFGHERDPVAQEIAEAEISALIDAECARRIKARQNNCEETRT